MKIETHTDGSKWIACTTENPQPERFVAIDSVKCESYHPSATEIDGDGADSHYKCPHCGKSWWVERDG